MHSTGSFTVAKCFNVSNVSLRGNRIRVVVVLEELSKTKQGPHLLLKLDVDGSVVALSSFNFDL